MTRLPFFALKALIVLLSLFSLTSSDAGAFQGLVQIRLAGEVSAPPAHEGGGAFGHLVEIEIDALSVEADASVVLHMHLASGTTGIELLQLVSSKLSAANIPATLSQGAPRNPKESKSGGGSLWVEGATRVLLRLGGGLRGEVSCVEGPPQSIRIQPASAIEGPAQVMISASTAVIMKGRAPIRGRATLTASLEKAEHAAEAATALWKAATNKWVSDRPGGDTWRPLKMSSGAAITGVSIRLSGLGDWSLEVGL